MKVGDTRPLRPTAKTTAATAAKAYGGAAAPTSVRDIADTASVLGVPDNEMTPKVREAIMTLMGEVDRLRSDLETTQRRMQELEQLADRDPLLPLYNRRAFVRELSRTMALVDRFDEPASLVYIDLNDFKKVNDAHGHAAGDAVLERISTILVQNVRQTDAVARLGGDEFGVILTRTNGVAAEEKGHALAELITNTVIDWKGEAIRVGAAWGALGLEKGQSVAEALEAADRAMYERKKDKDRG